MGRPKAGLKCCYDTGLGEGEFVDLGEIIAEIVKAEAAGDLSSVLSGAKARTSDLCKRFPIY